MATHVLGGNEVYNHDLMVPSSLGLNFPDGWVPGPGDGLTVYEWSTEESVDGGRTVKIINPSFTAGPVLVIQQKEFAIPVTPGEVWFTEVPSTTDTAGKDLRLIAYFLDSAKNYLTEKHLKFTSSGVYDSWSGYILVPSGAAFLQIAGGMQSTGTIWVDAFSCRRVYPLKAETVSQAVPSQSTFVGFKEVNTAVTNLPIFTPPPNDTLFLGSITISAPSTVAVTIRFGDAVTVYKGFFDADNRHVHVAFPAAVSAGIPGMPVTLTTSANVTVAVTVTGFHH